MGHGYQAIKWYPFKRGYDGWIAAFVAVFIAVFLVGLYAFAPPGQFYSPVQALMRATGSCAFACLTIVLCIGPLARLHSVFLPILFNRRHLGVATFLIALTHAGLVLFWYHYGGVVSPALSLLTSNTAYDRLAGFPFETLGALALIWLFVMAATSHDFWNSNLGPGLWKALHMGVYGVYALIIGHVALGALQRETAPAFLAMVLSSLGLVSGLHLLTALVSRRAQQASADEIDWIDAGPALDIPENRARIIQPISGERIAVFRYAGKISAISNVCRHQGGPLGEGRVIDGCVTCPWHGFQYRPEDGQSPPPFTEKVATYRVRLDARRHVLIDPTPLPPGTATAPALIQEIPA